MSILRRAHLTLVGAGVGGALAVANEILCARYLGVEVYGLYALALILARISEAFASFGLQVGAIHFISVQRDRGERAKVVGTLAASLLTPLVVGAGFAAAVYAFAPAIASEVFGNPRVADWIRAMAIAIPFMALSEVGGVMTRAFGHAGYYVVVRNLVPPLVFMALLGALAWRGAPQLWVAGAFVVAYAAAAAAALAAVALVAARHRLGRPRPEWALRELYAYSLPVLANTLLYLVVACTAILMLGFFHGDREVGIYRACMLLVIPFDMVVMAFNAAVAPLYPVLAAGGRREELAALVRRITGWMTMLSLLGILLVWFSRHDLMGLMGPEFVAGGDTLFAMALGQALLCAIGSAGYLLVMSGRQHYETFNAAAAGLACVVLNLWLVPPHGAYGGAVATTLALLLISVLRVAGLHHATGIWVVTGRFVRTVLAAALAAALGWASFHSGPLAEGQGVVVLAARLALTALYFVALYLAIAVDASERSAIVAALRRRAMPGATQAAQPNPPATP